MTICCYKQKAINVPKPYYNQMIKLCAYKDVMRSDFIGSRKEKNNKDYVIIYRENNVILGWAFICDATRAINDYRKKQGLEEILFDEKIH